MRIYSTLVPPEVLRPHLSDSAWLSVDCRNSLAAPKEGFLSYYLSYIPGAVYVELERDLSESVPSGQTGRHSLPVAPATAITFSRWGINLDTGRRL